MRATERPPEVDPLAGVSDASKGAEMSQSGFRVALTFVRLFLKKFLKPHRL